MNPNPSGLAPWGTIEFRGRVYDVLGDLAMALLTRTPVLSPRDDLTQPRADGIRSVLERALTVRPYYAPPPPLPDKTLEIWAAGDMRIAIDAERLSLLYDRAEGWITAHVTSPTTPIVLRKPGAYGILMPLLPASIVTRLVPAEDFVCPGCGVEEAADPAFPLPWLCDRCTDG